MNSFPETHTTGLPPPTIVNPAIEQMIPDAGFRIIPNAKPTEVYYDYAILCEKVNY